MTPNLKPVPPKTKHPASLKSNPFADPKQYKTHRFFGYTPQQMLTILEIIAAICLGIFVSQIMI
jgi:hypothetical protein